jgi:mRNA capping enzyme, catalytic domain/mRNA capping enzyme, C-terminal domain/mRNA capping enzyme, beta chain
MAEKRTAAAAGATPEEQLRAVYAKKNKTRSSGASLSPDQSQAAAGNPPNSASQEQVSAPGTAAASSRLSVLDRARQGMETGNQQRAAAEHILGDLEGGGNNQGSENSAQIEQFQVISDFMRRVAQESIVPRVSDPVSENVEIEVRFGERHGESFSAGIRQKDFDALVKHLQGPSGQGAPGLVAKFEHSVDYLYDADGSRVRATFDEKTREVTRIESKVKYTHKDITLQDFQYDIRMAVAVETQLELPADKALPAGWTLRRDKRRWSFEEEDFAFFSVDLTQVKSQGVRSGVEGESWEVEFEFKPEVIEYALAAGPPGTDPDPDSDAAASIGELEAIAEGFWSFVGRVMGSLREHSGEDFSDVPMQQLVDEEDITDKQDTILRLVPGCGARTDFPGSMPVAFSRRHFPLVCEREYKVSEKTDGIRYLLLCYDGGVYFVDRKFDVFFIQGTEPLLTPLAPDGVTLVDGELVRHLGTNRPYFMVFDAIAINGEVVATKPLEERLKYIRESVVKPFRDGIASGEVPGTVPFAITGKQFFDKGSIKHLLSRIRTSHQEQAGSHIDRIYQEEPREWSRHHKTDGLVFTPCAEPYKPFSVFTLLKWKYVDLMSVDFLYHRQKNMFTVGAQDTMGQREEVVVPGVKFSEDDMQRMEQDIMRQRGGETIVVECTYSSQRGRWSYVTLRPDKNKPNHMVTFIDTMQSIAENISIHEVIFQLNADNAGLDWHAMVAQAMFRINQPAPTTARPHNNRPPASGAPPHRPPQQQQQQQQS